MKKSDYKYFDKAKESAMLSDYHKTHVGCVAIYHGQVIGASCNCNKTHPFQKYYNRYREYSEIMPPKLHAEIRCINSIRHLQINFSRVKLYIYRLRKDQPFGMARPCPSCMAAIRDLGIKDIYYTTNNGYVHERIGKCSIGGAA